MTAEIITVGDEILIGQIVDTNSSFIAKELDKIGIAVHQITAVEDERNHILSTLEAAHQRADVVIITGGLGPTKDDLTKDCLCEYFDDELVLNEEVLSHIKLLFEKYIDTPFSELNRQQAFLPASADVLFNRYGTAAGMWFEKEGKVYVSLPGVPFEMKALMEEQVLPKLQESFKRPFIVHKTVITYGMGESSLAEKLEFWEENLPDYIKLAYLPNLGKVRLRLTGRGTNLEQLEDTINKLVTSLHSIIGEIIVGYEDENSIEVQIGHLLASEGRSLATAESFTGGRIGSLLASPPGASNYYKGTVVSYATSVKQDVLEIPEKLIQKHSVVSSQVAEAMARNVKRIFKTDFAISTTGNAGPTKGDSEEEIGTVFIGIATPAGVYSKKFVLGNHREKVIGKAVNKSMELLLEEVFKNSEKAG
ncbi:competence/damage-inducible protein A [Salegentibacter chungangensis]|uniref:CinA-like protein n=1 Tax=Salegentibacter chungangensis TaxID=1335724 RepID=A0ABW3NQL8_9FLAO